MYPNYRPLKNNRLRKSIRIITKTKAEIREPRGTFRLRVPICVYIYSVYFGNAMLYENPKFFVSRLEINLEYIWIATNTHQTLAYYTLRLSS